MLAVAAVALGACSFAGTMADHAFDYNKTIEDFANEQILLNALRAKDRKPMHFSSFSIIRGDLTLSVNPSVGASVPVGGDATSVYTFSPSIGVTHTTNPSFDVVPLDKQEFIRGILSPIKISTFKFYWDQGWPREILLYLLIHKVEEKFEKSKAKDNCKPLKIKDKGSFVNSPEFNRFGSFDGFVDWVQRVRGRGRGKEKCPDQKLRIGSEILGTPVGPAIDFAEPENLEALVKVAESKKELTFVTDVFEPHKQRLCKVSRSAIFCQGECPEPSLMESLKNCAGPVQSAEPERKAGVLELKSKKKDEKKKDEEEEDGISGSIHLRSVRGIIYYLGEVLRNDSDETKNPIEVRYGPDRKLTRLFELTNNPDEARRPAISITYGGKEYFVPKGQSGNLTLTALALVNQLLGLHKKSKELPATSSVKTVGP